MIIEQQPFDPAALGFVRSDVKAPHGTIIRWVRKANHGQYEVREFSFEGQRRMSVLHDADQVFSGAWPESHTAAIIIFHHLGLEIAQ